MNLTKHSKIFTVGTIFTLVLSMLGLTLVFSFRIVQLTHTATADRLNFQPADYTPTNPMYITSNDDFVAYGWTGNGSVENPYLLKNAEFSTFNLSSGHCIDIKGTTAVFSIENCYFHTDYRSSAGVYLDTVSNGSIVNSIFNATALAVLAHSCSLLLFQNLHCDSTVIVVDKSSQIIIDSCTIQWGPGDGISITRSSQITVQDCLIKYSAAGGIYLYFSDQNTIINNNVRDNTDQALFIDKESSLNTIYGNIFNEDVAPVKDDGFSNSWDDGSSKGNWYSDYDGSGTYSIPGIAGSIDHYPDGPLTSSTTTSSTTSTTTTNSSTTNGTIPIWDRPIVMVNITTYTPLDPSLRIAFAIWVVALLGGAAIILAIVSVRKGGLW